MKIKKLLNDYYPIFFFTIIILIFHLFFVRLMPKMDDGHFLGIVNAPSFSYYGWLKERYLSVSGRTVGEFLLAFFLKHNIVWWKIINSAAICYLTVVWYKIYNFVSEKHGEYIIQLFCCGGIFTMIISCLNPSVFWFAGSFSYLLPCAGMFAVIFPLVSYIYNKQVSVARMIISLLFVPIATMQEQSALCCATLYAVLLFFIIKEHRFKKRFLISIIPIILCLMNLFMSPGAKGRVEMEIQSNFPEYATFSFMKKIFCGCSIFFANSFYLSVLLTIVFSGLIIYSLWSVSDKTRKRFYFFLFLIICFICVILNLVVILLSKKPAHNVMRESFMKNSFSFSFYLMFIGGVALSLILFMLIIKLITKSKKLGLCVFFLYCAAFCSTFIMGFSPTAFASGQRTSFFANIFIFTACVFLAAKIKEGRIKNLLLKISIGYSAIFFAVEFFAYQLIEHPLMG